MNIFIKKKKYYKKKIKITGSKSITNRILLSSFLCFDQKTIVRNPLISTDTLVMIENIKKLSCDVKIKSNYISVCSKKGNLLRYNFSFKNAGTALRPLFAVLCKLKGNIDICIDGDREMRKRPLKGLILMIKKISNSIFFDFKLKKYFLPVKIFGFIIKTKLRSLKIKENVSSQYLTAILFLLPLIIKNKFKIFLKKIVSLNYIFLTINILKLFNINIKLNGKIITIIPGKFRTPKEIFCENDLVSLSYYLLIPLIKNKKISFIFNTKTIQSERFFINFLKKLGFIIYKFKKHVFLFKKKNISYLKVNCKNIIDSSMIIPVLIFFKFKKIKIYNIYNWRFKECNRIKAISKEIKKIGSSVIYKKNWMIVKKNIFRNNVIVNTYKDHRIAMCFSLVLFLYKNTYIIEPNVVKKTFPNYFI
ncbi:hypothetical protein [Candidatus Vidania fulgoroideorum]